MRTIIAGSRTITWWSVVWLAIESCPWKHEITSVVSGRAEGVDMLGEQWADYYGLPIDPHPVTKEEWRRYGKSAGYRRNERMAQNADALIAIYDGTSKGTKHMIDIAERYGLRVWIYDASAVVQWLSHAARLTQLDEIKRVESV